ncbi:uncharacterized protein LOC115954567 [Quercus lobata]|uniref:DUF674 domain-containing protein n=1 Tax=Quercus lobata TaxID=97700 RepID=A0A7N2MFF9_QUELO|nr:uncharacterized protein LOC115954567 [Quercus lobata]
MEETNVSLKLLIDRESQRVLFAEAGKEFIDFLFHSLALPIGTLVPLFEKQGIQGSFGNIYESIENLGSIYLQPSVNKDTLLRPKVQISGGGNGPPLLLQNIESSSTFMKLYSCARSSSACDSYLAYDFSAICPSCGNVMNSEKNMVDPPTPSASTERGYVKELVTYMVTDDLVVKPMSIISTITLLNKFNVQEFGALEEKVVNLGMDEGLKILKASLYSKNVLTDVFLSMLKEEVKCKTLAQKDEPA